MYTFETAKYNNSGYSGEMVRGAFATFDNARFKPDTN